MTSQPAHGRRDRKRLQTQARIEDAAVFLVLRDGLDATTVDAISERADVSPRTFFNYFDTKHSAILGVPQVRGDEDLVTVHRGGELVESVVRLLMDAMGVTLESRTTTHDDRLEVVRRHPEVLAGQIAALSERAGRLTAAIAELMIDTAAFAHDDDVAARSELMMALGMGAVKVAVREWAADGRLEPIESVHRRATALINETLAKLA
jgi:AcrR family transcriptional regulator